MISAINNGHVILANLIHSCWSLMCQEKGLLLRHNFREENAIADSLAKEAKKQENKQYLPGRTKLFVAPPFFVDQMLTKDMREECKSLKQLPISVCTMLRTLGNQNIASDINFLHVGPSCPNVITSDTMLCDMLNDA